MHLGSNCQRWNVFATLYSVMADVLCLGSPRTSSKIGSLSFKCFTARPRESIPRTGDRHHGDTSEVPTPRGLSKNADPDIAISCSLARSPQVGMQIPDLILLPIAEDKMSVSFWGIDADEFIRGMARSAFFLVARVSLVRRSSKQLNMSHPISSLPCSPDTRALPWLDQKNSVPPPFTTPAARYPSAGTILGPEICDTFWSVLSVAHARINSVRKFSLRIMRQRLDLK